MFEFQYKIQKNVASDYKTFPIVTYQYLFFIRYQNFLNFILIFFDTAGCTCDFPMFQKLKINPTILLKNAIPP
jgi:hypothetical protein